MKMKIYRDNENNYFLEIIRTEISSVGLCRYVKGKTLQINSLGIHIEKCKGVNEVELYELAFIKNNILEKINKSIERIKNKVKDSHKKVTGPDYMCIMAQKEIQQMIKQLEEIKNI